MNQTSQLEELRIDSQLLLEENKLMKEQINSLSVSLSALRGCTNIVNDFTSCALADDELQGNDDLVRRGLCKNQDAARGLSFRGTQHCTPISLEIRHKSC